MPSFWRRKSRDNTVVDGLCQFVAEESRYSVINSIQTGVIKLKNTDRHGRTILHWAVILGERQLVIDLLQEDVEIGATDLLGQSALHYAIQQGEDGILRSLLNSEHYNDREKRRRDASGRSLLHCALDAADSSIIQLCLMPELICLPDINERTPLHYAVICGRQETARILLSKGADIKARDGKGQTALHYAARSGSVGMIKELIEREADVAMKDHKGHTAGHRAAENGHRAATILLLDDDNLKLERADISTLLLQNVSDIDEEDDDGDTLLHSATKHAQMELINAILQRLGNNRSSSLSRLDREGKTPLHYILHVEEEQGRPINNAMLRQIIVTIGVKDLIEEAIALDDTAIMEAVLLHLDETGGSADLRFSGYTLLQHVAFVSDAKMITSLLRHLTQSNSTAYLTVQQSYYRTPLHIAAEYGDVATMGLMLRQIEQVGSEGIAAMMRIETPDISTPLHKACARDDLEVADLMLSFYMKTMGSAGLNRQDKRAWTSPKPLVNARLQELLHKAMSMSEPVHEISQGMASSSATTTTTTTKPQ